MTHTDGQDHPGKCKSGTVLTPCHPGHAAPPPLRAWREQVHQALAQGKRLLSLHGRRPGDADPGVLVSAVLLGHDGLQVLRGHDSAHAAYPSLTPEFAQAQMYERELWEQTGVVPENHPWLKPVRFEGRRQGHCSDYPFFSMRGQDVHEVGVGPIHAGVIEPGHFRFMCHGETVHHLEIQLGYQHRGVEALLLQRAPHWQSALVESVVGDSVIAYASAFHATLEHLSLQPTAPAVQNSRALALELERVAVHLATLTGLMTDIAYAQPAGTYQRLRTAIINATQKICGNRFGKGWIRPGCASPLDGAQRAELIQTLQHFLRDFEQVSALVTSSRSTQARLRGVGKVSAPMAADLGLGGVAARASGIGFDTRHALPNGAYVLHAPLTEPDGDCWARMRLRMRETQASTEWMLDRLHDLAFDLHCPAPHTVAAALAPWPLVPHAQALTVVEGARGPVMVTLETGHAGQLVHAKVQDPSLANWFGLAQALRGQQISDFPICNKSFDLSYCGNDL
ncbi:MAG: hydrogenase large subunit [Rhodoferax sp.]